MSKLSGGVLHAKYFTIDGSEVWIGSQNFDWRSLEHIQELGVRVVQPEVARSVNDVFALDWAFAGGEKLVATSLAPGGYNFPVQLGSGESALQLTPVFSPQSMLPDAKLWELPKIVELIDGARTSVRVQVMSYRTLARDKTYFDTLEAALRRAAARGVKVELLCADWSKRAGTIEGLQSLEPLENVEVRLTTIPQWTGGYIPFARVSHAKYMVIDAQRGWIGTSNWERLLHQQPQLGRDRRGRADRFATRCVLRFDLEFCLRGARRSGREICSSEVRRQVNRRASCSTPFLELQIATTRLARANLWPVARAMTRST